MRVIANTSPLIALDRVGELDLLRQLYGSVVRPQSVLDEILAGRDLHSLNATLRDAAWIVTEPDPPEIALRRELGAGETAVIALALRTGADLIILDDLQARLVADGLGLRIAGTIGVHLAAHRMGLLHSAKEVLVRLAETGFRFPPEVVARYELR